MSLHSESVQSDDSSEMTASTVIAVRLCSPVVVLCLVLKAFAEGEPGSVKLGPV